MSIYVSESSYGVVIVVIYKLKFHPLYPCCISFMCLAKLLLGDVLKEGTPLSINPLVIWAWAGLLINAINSIPAGELDGGRISFAIWGRKVCHTFHLHLYGKVNGDWWVAGFIF